MKRKSLAELQKLHIEMVTKLAVAKKAIDAVKRKNLAELQNLHDEMVKELAVLKRAIDALKAVQGKPKRAKK